MGPSISTNGMPDLHSASVSEKELYVDPKGIDFTRPLSEYPTAQEIADFINYDIPTQHIYTKDLNVNGKAIADKMETYLENESISSGMLKEALKTPLHLAFSINGDKEELAKMKDQAGHFNLGDYLHQAILEPTKFARAIVEPKYSLASKDGVALGVAFWEKLISENMELTETPDIEPKDLFASLQQSVLDAGLSLDKQDGKKTYLRSLKDLSGMTPVTEENFTKIQILKKHYEAYGGGILQRLLKHSKREISLYAKDPETGRDLKVRPDALQFEENIGANAIISVKSSAVEDLRAFYYQSAKLHYDLSEGMYQDIATQVTGRDFNCTIMIMLQTVAPFAIAILVWSAEDIETGKHKFRRGLQVADECLSSEDFIGYDAFAEAGNFGLIQMELPQWNNKEFLPISLDN